MLLTAPLAGKISLRALESNIQHRGATPDSLQSLRYNEVIRPFSDDFAHSFHFDGIQSLIFFSLFEFSRPRLCNNQLEETKYLRQILGP